MEKRTSFILLLSLLFGFFVMGFVDVVGIATSYVRADFSAELPAQYFGFLPSVVLIWFLIFSIPTSLLMNRIGRKNTVLLSVLITFLGMLIPFTEYNLITCLVGFAFLGIGNTILQVSLMPLLTNVVSAERLAGVSTCGQAVKAVSSFLGPFVALFAATYFGSWQYIFSIFGGITLIFGIWLYFSKIERENVNAEISLGSALKVLCNKAILPLFFGIVAVVGIDMGMNMGSPMLVMERLGLDPSLQTSVERVALVSSVYFACRTIGAFVGTALLAKMSAVLYFRLHIILGLLVLVGMFFAQSEIGILILIGAMGYSISGIFSVIFSIALNSCPNKENEISGLMITAVFGGAILPPMMTFSSDVIGSQNGAICVLGLALIYLLYCAFTAKKA